MILKEVFYGVQCNRCREIYESSEGHSFYADEYSAEEDALESDWIERDGKHYCPSCYKRRGDEEDESEFEILPPIPQSVWHARNYLAACYKHGPNSVSFSEDEKEYVLKMYLPDKNCMPDYVLRGLDALLGDEWMVFYDSLPKSRNDRVVIRIGKDLAKKVGM